MRCEAGTDCQSGICADGRCCDQACGGPCEACSGAGHCEPIGNGQKPRHGTCPGNADCQGTCNGGDGACHAAEGASCACPALGSQGTCVAGTCTSLNILGINICL
jgi:hypothetical protein